MQFTCKRPNYQLATATKTLSLLVLVEVAAHFSQQQIILDRASAMAHNATVVFAAGPSII